MFPLGWDCRFQSWSPRHQWFNAPAACDCPVGASGREAATGNSWRALWGVYASLLWGLS
jgi:hypothetical protein